MIDNKKPSTQGRLIVYVILSYCFIVHPAIAQEKEEWEKSRQIEDIEVEIVRDKQIIIPEANRNFEKIPPHSTDSVKPTLSYMFQPVPFLFSIPAFSIRPMRLKQEPISKIYGSFLSMGFGNYIAPYIEAWFNSKRNEKKSYGAHIYHRSASIGPVDKKNSALFESNIKAFGALYGKKLTLDTYIEYENKVGYFYGYESGKKVRRDTIQQIYHVATIGATLAKTNPGRFDFLINTDVSYLADHYSASEIMFTTDFNSHYTIGKKSTISLPISYLLISQEYASLSKKLRHLITLKPAFEFTPFENMSIKAGVNAIVNKEATRKHSFYIYPHVRIQYDIIKNLRAYAAVSGDADKVSLHTLAADNFWINNNLTILHTNRSYEFQIGLQGKIGQRVDLEAGFSRVELKSLYMYQNAPTDPSKFNAVYDDVEQLNVFAKIRYKKSKKILLDLQGDYFHYSPQNGSHPWHKPTYRIALNSFFDIYKKILVNLNFLGQGGMHALDPMTGDIITLDPALDLNLRINYFISKPFSVFVKLENILSNNYPRYLNYNVRGFQILGGISWSF